MTNEDEHVPAWGDPDYGAFAERLRQELDLPNARAKAERRNKTPHPIANVEAMRREMEERDNE